ncbi:MAG: NAD(P)H-dependent oxidoreductase [Myxococcaceae bacterium]|nr:NAD(P)H-dependent oxidoreductase [Myxococcaceae bacterium]
MTTPAPDAPLRLKLIVGSTRAERTSDPVVRWALPLVQAHPAFTTEVLDLRDWPLPFFQEGPKTIGDPRAPSYSDPLVKRWNQTIVDGDAFVMVTPEYNHGPPAVLKNAIDSVFFSFGFRHKSVGFIGYSAGIAAGVRAVEQLNTVMLETEAVPVRTQVLIPNVAAAFDPAGKPVNPVTGFGLQIMLDDLAWLGRALRTARAQGEPPPPTARLRAAMSAPRT